MQIYVANIGRWAISARVGEPHMCSSTAQGRSEKFWHSGYLDNALQSVKACLLYHSFKKVSL